LPELIAALAAGEAIYVPEGEKDCDRLAKLGLAATCNPGGAGKWDDSYSARFAGASVIVIADRDPAGEKHARQVARSLEARGAHVEIKQAAVLDKGADVSDHLDAGYSLDDLVPFVPNPLLDDDEVLSSHDDNSDDHDPTVTFAEFVAREDDNPKEPLVTIEQGVALPAGGLALLVATTSHGKTTLAVEFILHASAGLDYLGLSFPRALRVLVIQNEGPRDAFRLKLEARLAHWHHGGEPRIWDVPNEWGMVRLSDETIRARLRRVVEQHEIDLVVSDSLTRFGVKGNGTPEETRDFVVLMTDVGLGRDLAFLLLAHPRTRSDPSEDELERIAGAWPPHADLILHLKKLDGNRARLSYPKTRWPRGQKPPSILAFDPNTETFAYMSDDVPVERDFAAELFDVMSDGEWWTVNALRKPKNEGGIGAAPESIKQALADKRFESVNGAEIGRRKDSTYYRLQASRDADDASRRLTLLRSEEGKRHASSPIEREAIGDDAYASPDPHVLRHDASRRLPAPDASQALDDDEVERLADLALQAQRDDEQ
jgi:5S rRNA maturation endonuclease (ribonuclease M5)